MIKIKTYKTLLDAMVADINASIAQDNAADADAQLPTIDNVLLCVNEAHAIKILKDCAGVALLAKMADTDTRGNNDEFAELNHELIYVIEKTSASELSNEQQVDKYDMYQELMRRVKEYLLQHRSADYWIDKPFRTEFEYNVFGGYGGLSITFDLKDFEL